MNVIAAGVFAGLGEPWASLLIGLLAIVGIVYTALVVGAVAGVVKADTETRTRVAWIAFIVFFPLLAAILWFAVGRARVGGPSVSGRRGRS